ncbi:GntR family transcriptional regulator [Phenylobacterium sp.]|uniref:GntR family transcriptional regulator n=1 Tax=Phenylobacterium sp. TaxID=1871053 RepID=UPI002F403129
MGEAVDRAYQAIREGIMRGTYAQGAHITAQGLATASGLSRTPVREAMRRLDAEGLIRIIPNRGAFVVHWDKDEIQHIYDLRVLLEGFAAESAALHVTPEQLLELRAIADEMQAMVISPEPSREAIAEVNDRFHKAILKASGNSRLQELLNGIVEMSLVLSTFRHYQIEELRRSANQHSELVSALEVRDPAWARNVMAAHILSARHTLLNVLSN